MKCVTQAFKSAIFTFVNDEAPRRNTLSCGVFDPGGFSTSCALKAESPSLTTVYSTSCVGPFSTMLLFCFSPIVSVVQVFELSLNSFRLTEVIMKKFATKFLNMCAPAVATRTASGVSKRKD